MDVTKHAISRLKNRFGYGIQDLNNILSILNNPHSCKYLPYKKDGKHYKFKYRGNYIIAVMKQGMVVTFKYEDNLYKEIRKEQRLKGLAAKDDKRMTVKEVADVLGVGSEAIKWHARKLFPASIQNGKTTYLTESQVVEIKSKMQPTSQLVGAKTDIEMMNQIADSISWLNSKISSLEKENQVMIPKAAFYDQVTSSKDAIDIGSAAKVLSIKISGKVIGRNKLFELLRDKGILMSNNQPYQKWVDLGYFRTIEQKYTKADGSTSINIKTVVYQKGLDYIRKVVSK